MTEAAERAALEARLARLEEERRHAFDEAQREADALFAQYQLSQLTAAGGASAELASVVLVELVRLADAAGGALLIADPAGSPLRQLAVAGAQRDDEPLPALPDLAAARSWAAAVPGTVLVSLADDPPTLLGLWAGPDRALDEDGVRIALLSRHELGVSLRDARLRETLDRERAELKAIVEAATDVILGADADGRLTRLNPAGRRLLGLGPDDPLGRPCEEVLGCTVAGGHPTEDCPLRRVAATRRPVDYLETAVRGGHGGAVRMVGSYAPLVAPGADDPAGATAILRDVTAARALEDLREGFVATVSHELRTPLALVRGYAETLRHLELDSARQRSIVERIEEVTTRLASLVDQILDITHLDADPVVLERAPTPVATILARVRADLAAAGIEERLEVDLPPDLPPVDADLARVGQVLENVLGNALKYAPPGSPIRVTASAVGERVAIAVEDEGIGIPDDERGLILEPFHRAWNVRESRIPGTGLGLYISRRLVEAHGGTLILGDRPDGRAGTRVAIELPAAPVRRAARPAVAGAGR